MDTNLSRSRDAYKPYASACYKFLADEFHTSSTTSSLDKDTPLEDFILHALEDIGLAKDVVVMALFLLHRLKSRFPVARVSDGGPLIIAALMVAHKTLDDDPYKLEKWYEATQKLIPKRRINQHERELLGHLEFKVQIRTATDVQTLEQFKRDICWPDQPTANRSITYPLRWRP